MSQQPVENFELSSDLMVAAGNGTQYDALKDFFTSYRPNMKVIPTPVQGASLLLPIEHYITNYRAHVSNQRYPLTHVNTSPAQILIVGSQACGKSLHTTCDTLTVLNSLGTAKAYTTDILHQSVDIAAISRCLRVYKPRKASYLRYIDLYCPSFSDRPDQNELHLTSLFELRGLSDKFFAFEEDIPEFSEDLPMEELESLMQVIFQELQFGVTYSRLEPCGIGEIKYLFLINKSELDSPARFTAFQLACQRTEEMLLNSGLIFGGRGGIYARGSPKKVVDLQLVQKAPMPKPKSTPRSLRSGSHRERIANLLNPEFHHDSQGDSAMSDPSVQPPVSMQTDSKYMNIKIPFANAEMTELDLKRFRQLFERQFSCKQVECGVIYMCPFTRIATIQMEEIPSTSLPFELVNMYHELAFNGSRCQASITTKHRDYLRLKATKGRKRRFSDVSMSECAAQAENDGPIVKRLRLGVGVEAE